MPRVTFTETPFISKKGPPERRTLVQVGLPNPGPSSRGSTFYKSWLACPREHGLRYVAGIHPSVEQEPLTVGLLYHQALEMYYGTIVEHQRGLLEHMTKRDEDFYFGGHKRAMQAAYKAIEPISAEKGYEETYELVERLLTAYFEMYAQQDRWEILAVEETLEWHGIFTYTARIDLIVRDQKDGGMWIVEHKTARALTDNLLDNYQLDWQILGQIWLMTKCLDLSKYPPFKGVMINLASKHKTPRLVRVPINPSPAHLREFERNFGRWQSVTRAAEAAGYPKSLGHCAGFARGYSKCDYYAMCHDFPEHTIEDWQRDNPPLGYHLAEDTVKGVG